MNSLQRSPALLTRSEIDYLLNKKHVDPNYEYVIRHRIKEKLDRFIQLEIPLLEKASSLHKQGDEINTSIIHPMIYSHKRKF